MPEANMFIEKRGTPRISIKIPVKYRLEEDQVVRETIAEWQRKEKNAYTLDMSLGGMRIVVDQSLMAGEILRFDLFLLDKTNVVTIYAEVKWTDEKSAGLHFLMMKNEEMEYLKDFLEKSAGKESN